jgi:menaquinone-dependent protoporphyrinogen oxidase
MRTLITYASKRGGTQGIARMVGDELAARGVEVEVMPAEAVGPIDGFDAVIVGGALYANRWPRSARRFVKQHTKELAAKPVWFFSSGPLDDTPRKQAIPPTSQVKRLMDRVHARGHTTFGGRLEPDAKGFIASRMAKSHSGDWRDQAQIKLWADGVVDALQPR